MPDITPQNPTNNVVPFRLEPAFRSWFDTARPAEAIKLLSEFPALIADLADQEFEVIEPFGDIPNCNGKWIPGDSGLVCFISFECKRWWVTIEHSERGNAHDWGQLCVKDFLRWTRPLRASRP